MNPERHPDLVLWFDAQGHLVAGRSDRGDGLALSPDLVELLGLLDGSRDLAALAQAMPWPGASAAAKQVLVQRALERLAQAGLLRGSAGPAPAGGSYLTTYGLPSVHRTYVGDAVRLDAYRRALAQVVRPGDVVIEVGAGTGVLSVLAAQAGARAVHAIEPSAIGGVIEAVARANGVGDRVVVHRDDASEVELDLQADVLLVDWVGNLVVKERIFPAAAVLRDRCLAPQGRMIPGEVTLFLAPAEDAAARREGAELWASRPGGLDLSPVRDLEYAHPVTSKRSVGPQALLAPLEAVRRFDGRRMSGEEAQAFPPSRAAFTAERDGTLDGLCACFVSELAPGALLDTRPGAPETFYRQHWLPVAPLPLARGERLEVALSVERREGEQPVVLEGEVAGDAERRFRYVYDVAPPPGGGSPARNPSAAS